ncbi:MAG: aminodeoxychorismate/anthranilate synthase component II [Flavobacteriales bacterium]|nr:aminodeoxychorismate/anthranilate synthase component II [Flavobacteriales bacterium]
MNILIIDNYDSFTYNILNFIPSRYNCKIIRNDDVSILDADEFDKIIISPGPGKPKDTGFVNDFLIKYYKTKSILGICLGMQCICEFFGASLINLKNVLHGVQTKLKVVDSDCNLYKGIKGQIVVGHYHSWVVDSIPDYIKVTAFNENNLIMSVKHKKYDLEGLQFHPESIITNYGEKIILNWFN